MIYYICNDLFHWSEKLIIFMEFKKEGPSNLHSRMMRNFRMVSFWVKRRISYFSFQKNIKKLDPSLRCWMTNNNPMVSFYNRRRTSYFYWIYHPYKDYPKL